MYLFNDWYEWSFGFFPGICLICVLVVTVVNVLLYRELRGFLRRQHPEK